MLGNCIVHNNNKPFAWSSVNCKSLARCVRASVSPPVNAVGSLIPLMDVHLLSNPTEQDEKGRESTEQWREFHYDGMYPSHQYNPQAP